MAVEQASSNSAMEAFYKDIQAKHLDALWRTGGGAEPLRRRVAIELHGTTIRAPLAAVSMMPTSFAASRSPTGPDTIRR